MSPFFQVIGGVLLAVIMGLTLSKLNKDISAVLGIGVCCMVMIVMAAYLEPVINLIKQLQQAGRLDLPLLKIMLKATGIGIVAEIAGLICTDSGNAALGKAIQILSAAVVLWLAIPMFQSLLELVQRMLGEL